ncbi:hypothetical protein [Streptomyces sp. NPDC085665]|uniref:hypothetical protein n=1 Tax=Streptomyces sp. NPDC085665 TaxID=3365735 RepID=UPI0037D27227
MQELRFDDIRFTAAVNSDQTWLRPALGGHELSVQLAVGVSPFDGAGKILALEAELFGFGAAPAQRSRLGRVTTNLAHTPVKTVHRANLVFSLTSLQVHAIEEARIGDVRFEIDLNATLPPGARVPGVRAGGMRTGRRPTPIPRSISHCAGWAGGRRRTAAASCSSAAATARSARASSLRR